MRIPVTNNTAMPIYVGSSMIPAGETRHFEENEVPLNLRPRAPAPAPEAPKPEPTEAEKLAASAAELIQQPVGEIREHFSAISSEYLDELERLENAAEKPRKSLLEAIAAERLQRAGSGA